MSELPKPYISASENMAELTVKSVLLGIVLSMVLAAANAYLGLFAGMTVSASIPAAVMSMAILRILGRATILENNGVQTAASAGESLAAGVIFTFPALIMMGTWDEFNFWQTTLIAACGGILGVLFTIPLRSALIVRQKLLFPEGVATAEVLKTGTSESAEAKKSIVHLAWAAVAGATFKFFESGLQLWHAAFDVAGMAGGKVFMYFGAALSPALLAVGYIVGIRVAVLIFIGGAFSWWVAIPVWSVLYGNPDGLDAVSYGFTIWSTKVRYLGVGAMIVGGLWAIISMRSSLVFAMKSGLQAYKDSKLSTNSVPRTEKDSPMPYVLAGIVFMIIPVLFIYQNEIESFGISLFMAVLMVMAGFLFSAVAGYMAGLVGSSNNPISGVTIATILMSSLLLLAFMGTDSPKGPAAAILIGAVVCCAAAIAGDNMQDLKAGHLLGATPYKQQIMQVVGVIAAAIVIVPVLNLLNEAYGFGPKTAMHPRALPAPQATLMHSVAEGVFGGGLPWNMIGIGAILATIVIMIDLRQERLKSSFRIPVLAVAVGLYLPLELDSTIFLGGILAAVLATAKSGAKGHSIASGPGLLFASGLITGEALVGILIAIPVAYYGRTDVLKIVDQPLGSWPGMLALAGISYWLYKVAKKAR